jgi:hypothetical protein
MKKNVFVADAFANQYRGGAELTTDAIMSYNKNNQIAKINSKTLTEEIVNANKDFHFIICNFSDLEPKAKLALCRDANYSIIEYDYKFCSYRSPEKHKAVTGKECDCIEKESSKLNLVFYGRAEKVWFMSAAQRDIFLSKVKTIKEQNTHVLSSIFAKGDLTFMKSIRDNPKNDKYLILDSGSWIKGTQANIDYAKDNDLEYELIKNLQYHELLIKMSTSKGLIFRPLGADTCPRIVMEAKLLGCELILNDYVQHKDEEWFATVESCEEYLDNRAATFWSYYE